MAGDIADNVYRQLSEYAKEIINARAEDYGVSFNSVTDKYRNEYEEIEKSKDKHKVYILKSQSRCKMYYDNEKEPYYGVLHGTKDVSIVKLVSDDNSEKFLDWEKIVSIERQM